MLLKIAGASGPPTVDKAASPKHSQGQSVPEFNMLTRDIQKFRSIRFTMQTRTILVGIAYARESGAAVPTLEWGDIAREPAKKRKGRLDWVVLWLRSCS